MTIKPFLSTGQLLTMTRDENGNLEARSDPPEPAYFEVKMDFGVGVAAFSLQGEGGLYLAVDEHGMVHLQAAKVERKCGVCILKSKQDVAQVSFQFYIDQCWPVKVGEGGQQYISLNYYLSTLNCESKLDQSIREDEVFQSMVKKAKREEKISKTSIADAILCAEYCYYVYHVSAFDCDDKIRQVLSNDIDNSPFSQLPKALHTFIQELEKSQEEECERVKKSIKPEAFKMVWNEIRDSSEKVFRNNLKKVQRNERLISEFGGKMLGDSFVAYLMHHSEQELQKVVKETHSISIIKKLKEMLGKNDCQKMVETWKSLVQGCETHSLVMSLIQSGQQKFGKMKIVRAKNMETANQLYNTLKLAQEGCNLKECFEIIKDLSLIHI